MSMKILNRYVDQVSQKITVYVSQLGQCKNSECELETAQQCQRELACENCQRHRSGSSR
ncbi:hypothetical protein HC723_14590 [Vibrio sp. S11_S32]|uniref:hypothetical protein n=1 Tax=Vibrio sp. S11_S32 TaxID=2720225 RepID=UPI001680437F|nr:hypothetical protein [Vibrio sp. S11_S32]MBD1577637.1 hypothetical protein [Vibrio sp. S11_S32]